jgi:hypothetical protein
MMLILFAYQRIFALLILLSSSAPVSGRSSIIPWRTKLETVFGADSRNIDRRSSILLLSQRLRGGSTSHATASSSSLSAAADNEVKAYRLQQQLYLQSRSLQLRQALLARGLDGFAHCEQDDAGNKRNQVTDWDCALATTRHPKSCLYSFDAQEGTKVVAPIDSTQYITLSALNRLRRNDPTKVEPLWHSQYAILKTWFSPDHPYSLYNHLSFKGTALSLLLDRPLILSSVMTILTIFVFLLTLPFWEGVLTTFLTSQVLWMQWPQWGRFLHAALPLQLMMAQMAWKGLAQAASLMYAQVRQQLIEWECEIWEDCIPLTILEGEENADDSALADDEEEDSRANNDDEQVINVDDVDDESDDE